MKKNKKQATGKNIFLFKLCLMFTDLNATMQSELDYENLTTETSRS